MTTIRLVVSSAGFTVITAIGLALAACGTVRSASTPDQMPLLPETSTTAGAGPPGRMTGTTPAGRPAPRATSTPANLNRRLLLEQSARAAGDTDLPVGPGDLIEVSVFEVEELSKLKVRVPLKGAISLPLVGQIPAAGRTTAELEDEIRTRLQRSFMHDPQVSVFVHEHNSQRVSVIGAVRRGGVFPLNRQLRLADALALAEGLADDADSFVYVIRRVPAGTVAGVGGAGPRPAAVSVGPGATEEVMTSIDLSALADGREELNVPLQSGDVVHVPRAGSVYVGGSVERAGSFVLRGRTNLHQAILAAGGVKDVAAWSDVRLYRRGESGEVSVSSYDLEQFEEGQPSPELQRNDVVVIGKHPAKAFFYGFIDFFKGALGVAKGI
ncbi:MAG: polysaccharide biosynthesis/export family protein [Candidatus Rokuibacteriota bacterium]